MEKSFDEYNRYQKQFKKKSDIQIIWLITHIVM